MAQQVDDAVSAAARQEAATMAMLAVVERQAQLTEEIRDQFAEHLELQRQILRLLMAERR